VFILYYNEGFISVYTFNLRFYSKHNTLPVNGNIEDMISDTENYIHLKRMYERKGQEDRAKVKVLAAEVVSSLNWNEDDFKKVKVINFFNTIETDHNNVNYFDILCKNWSQVSLFTYSTLKQEQITPFPEETSIYESHEKRNFIWYLLVKTSDIFYKKYNRHPGQTDHSNFEKDISTLRNCLNEFFTEEKNQLINFHGDLITDDYLFEFCRFSNSRVAPIASIMGSIASQEIIKLITYQFKTFDNTLIFDGIHSTLSLFKF
jgi:amyloid beta precursor protein binding protein 1